jgi:two-component system chemotaxis sensor kinase CheA
MNMDPAKQTFAQEAAELLQAMEDALLSLEAQPDDAELLHQVFRAMHTIKGTAGVFGFDLVVRFTHTVETVMDAVRSGEQALDRELTAILLDCRDHTAALVDAVLAADDPNALEQALLDRGAQLLARLETASGADSGQSQALAQSAGRDPEVEQVGSRATSDDSWVIALEFGPDALRNGMDPLSFLRYLRTLGDIEQIFTDTRRLPGVDQFDPENCYLGFRIFFSSQADKQAIEQVFEFAADDCDIHILPPQSRVEKYLALLDDLPENQVHPIGEMLQSIGALTANEVAHALRLQSAADDAAGDDGTHTPLGKILVEQHAIQQPVVEQALEKQQQTRQRVAQESRFIRVDSQRLGRLIDLVGELVINSAAMRVMVERHGIDEMQDVVDGVDHLVEEIRDNALQLRMVQIGDTFSRFRRVVRDVSRELGKDIELVIEGGETELDKTVVEKINDPLTHLIRNSLDHGIETPEARLAKGKPAAGKVWLNAYHDSGHIVIEIRDDGAGLDADRIRAKAEAKGLVRPDEVLTREEVLRLIFEPGLSTKDAADDLSGRGVGMDVVRRNIEMLRGTVELDSEHGVGTTVTIVLPLTLAIIDGFLVGSGTEQYVIPLSQVVECVEIGADESVRTQDQHYVNLRGEVLPYLRLKQFFAIPDGHRKGRESLVVVRFGHHKAGLVVDELFGELQTVIKPLGKIFEQLRGIAGATVLGTGGIALILDVQELTSLLHAENRARHLRLVNSQ